MGAFSKFFFRNQWPLLVVSFFTGWISFYLKLTSLQKLVDSLSLEAFPVLMIGQGILLLALHAWFKKFQQKISWLTNGLVFLSAIVLVVSSQSSYWETLPKMEKVLVSCFYFLSSTLLVMWLESTVSNVCARFINLLKGPFQVEQNQCSFEIGILGGAMGLLLMSAIPILPSMQSWLNLAIMGVGLGTLLMMEFAHLYLMKKGEHRAELPLGNANQKEILDPTQYPFVPFLLGLIFILMASKHLQNLAVLLGMIDFKENGGISIGSIFAKITIFQNLLIVGVHFFTLSSAAKLKSRSWSVGIKIFLGLQILSMLVLVVKGHAWVLITTGVVRKLTQHLLLNPALMQFEGGIPFKLRAILKEHHEKWAMGPAFIFVGLYSTLTIYGPVPHIILWFCGVALALVGFWCRKMLLEKFNEFQISNILNLDLFSGARAAHLLAETDASKHANALINLLEQNPPPMMARALGLCLGKMPGPRTMEALMQAFHKYSEEDVKVAIAKALSSFNSLEVDLFFRQELKSHLKEQSRTAFWTGELFHVYADRMEREVLASLLELISNNRNDSESLPIYLGLFGEVIKRKNRPELACYLVPYLAPEYSRKIQASVIVSLYNHKQFGQNAREGLESFLTSPNMDDRILVCEIVGELILKDFIPFVLHVAQDLKFQNSDVLLSLLRLGEPRAHIWLVECLADLAEKEVAKVLWALSSHVSPKTRFMVYEQMAASRPDGIEWTFAMLQKAPAICDLDLTILFFEVARKTSCLPSPAIIGSNEKITQERLVA